MKAKQKHMVVHDHAGRPFGTDQRDSYWGPFSAWTGARPTFFCALAAAQMDAAGWYEHLHRLPPEFPMPILGQPSVTIDKRGIGWYPGPIALIRGGCRLDVLLLRVRLLAVECESFRTLKEGLEAR